MSISLIPEIKNKILEALFCDEPFETSAFVRINGMAKMRFDNVSIESLDGGKVRVSFAWRGKDIMYLENDLAPKDRLTITMDGAFDVRID